MKDSNFEIRNCRLSVILPTYNCANELPEHIDSMNLWLDLADEIIAVDSDSDDATSDIIRTEINHPGLLMIQHPRGLYQSWNHAISKSNGKWIYISTIGDTITREHLEHLLTLGDSFEADVVLSQPEFIFAHGINFKKPVWPIQRMIEAHDIQKPIVLNPLVVFAYAAMWIPDSISGSSASNLYLGSHLRERLFPTEYGRVGDTAWIIRYALETRICLTNQIGSVFRFHSDGYTNPIDYEEYLSIISSLREECEKVAKNLISIDLSEFNKLFISYINTDKELVNSLYKWRKIKNKSVIPWYLRLAAIKARHERKSLATNKIEITNKIESLINKHFNEYVA